MSALPAAGLSRRAVLWAGVLLLPAVAAAAREGDAAQVFADPLLAALARAVAMGQSRKAQALIGQGADLAGQGDRGVTLLQWALLRQDRRAMDLLLDLGADPAQPGIDGDSVVHLAAMARDPGWLRSLLQRHAPADVANRQTGRTPLMSAVLAGRGANVARLLAAGADPARADGMGNTALHVAGQTGDADLALALLQAGAPPLARNRQGHSFRAYLFMTPEGLLTGRAKRARQAVVEWLAAQGIDAEAD
jgi:ankyrin repeat protein